MEQLVQGGTEFASAWSFLIKIIHLYKIKVLYFMKMRQFGHSIFCPKFS